MHIVQEKILDIKTFIHRKVAFTLMKNISLSEEQIKLMADALWMRQRCFIAGDRRFKEYGAMLDSLLEGIDYTPSRY